MEATTGDFLGTGWAFPPRFTDAGGSVEMVANEEDIHQSLQLLFSTRRGERPMRERYGCSLDDWLFSALDHDLESQLISAIHDAVLLHEPRVRLLDVDVSPDGADASVLRIRLDYRVVATNSRFNLVFPFYRQEASPGAL
ncbi:MAG: GPW/gp25 family protein [Cyanobacteriota bacterium]|nr:GPW/gp25 family protein [Cyanobacteriota bacterium]